MESILGAHARLLRDRGHTVRIITGRGEGELIPELDSRHPGVEAVYQALGRGENASGPFEDLRRTLRERLSETLAGSVVIAHNVLTMPFNLPLAAALHDLSQIPVIAWTHDLAWTNPRYLPYQREDEPYRLLRSARPVTTYVAISELRRSEIAATLDLAPERIPLVPNGVDLEAMLHIRPNTAALLRRVGLDGPGPLLLAPVRVTRRKRLELAFEAVTILKDEYPDLRLAVSGPLGPHSADNLAYWSTLREHRRRLELEREVVFLHEFGDPHPVDDEMMGELYRLAAAVVLPSESEGFGIPVLEAGVNRVPVVCAELPVFREAAGSAVWTFPVQPDAETVAATIAAALATPQARLQERVRREYGWDAVVRRIEEVIALAA